MIYLIIGALIALIVAADQLVKLWVVQNIPLHGHMDMIPGVLGLTYVQNRGAAFSMLQDQQWLFAVIFVLFAVFLVWEFATKKLPFTKFERGCIVAIFAGGLGNMIDRVRLGFVVDMLRTEFMNFPIFNVADCFITCGCIALLVHLVLFNKQFWKDEAK